MKRSSAASAAPPCRILLINENRHGLVARKAVLEQAGYKTAAVLDAHEGLEEFAQGDYPVIIVNYRMPGITWSELISRVREIRHDAIVIVITGMAEVLGLNEQNTGSDAVIPKSSNEASHLVRTVARLLRSQTPRKPQAVQGAHTQAAAVAAVQL